MQMTNHGAKHKHYHNQVRMVTAPFMLGAYTPYSGREYCTVYTTQHRPNVTYSGSTRNKAYTSVLPKLQPLHHAYATPYYTFLYLGMHIRFTTAYTADTNVHTLRETL